MLISKVEQGLYVATIAQCAGSGRDRMEAIRDCLAIAVTVALLHCVGGGVLADILLLDWEPEVLV